MESHYFSRTPKTATTVAEELKDPKSLLSMEINNALINRDVLLRQLKIKEFQYVTALQAQEEAEDAENEEAAERRREKQDAMLRQSLEEYYEEQHQIAVQAVAMGAQPLNSYERLMAAVADHQFQINIITARLYVVNEQIQMTKVGYAQAVESWQAARHSYVDSYFDSVYQTPFRLGDKELSMDLDSDEYGAHLSPEKRAMIEEHRRESRGRAGNVLPPLEALSKLQEMDSKHIALKLRDKNKVALNRHEFIHSIHDIVPVKNELQMWVEALPEEQQVRMMREVVTMHRGFLRMATTLVMETQGNSVLIQQRLRQMKEAHDVMVLELRMKEKLQAEKRELEASKSQKIGAMQQILVGLVDLYKVQSQPPQLVSLFSGLLEAASRDKEDTMGMNTPESASLRNMGMRSSGG